MPKDAYELVVMFFRLTNLLETFQVMMNDLLRNLIKIGDVAASINNVMVGMKTEKENNDIMKKILKRMAENNLFVKPEKYL